MPGGAVPSARGCRCRTCQFANSPVGTAFWLFHFSQAARSDLIGSKPGEQALSEGKARTRARPYIRHRRSVIPAKAGIQGTGPGAGQDRVSDIRPGGLILPGPHTRRRGAGAEHAAQICKRHICTIHTSFADWTISQ